MATTTTGFSPPSNTNPRANSGSSMACAGGGVVVPPSKGCPSGGVTSAENAAKRNSESSAPMAGDAKPKTPVTADQPRRTERSNLRHRLGSIIENLLAVRGSLRRYSLSIKQLVVDH